MKTNLLKSALLLSFRTKHGISRGTGRIRRIFLPHHKANRAFLAPDQIEADKRWDCYRPEASR